MFILMLSCFLLLCERVSVTGLLVAHAQPVCLLKVMMHFFFVFWWHHISPRSFLLPLLIVLVFCFFFDSPPLRLCCCLARCSLRHCHHTTWAPPLHPPSLSLCRSGGPFGIGHVLSFVFCWRRCCFPFVAVPFRLLLSAADGLGAA